MRVNREENLVAEMFSKRGYNVDKEPDGNIPPDLLLNGTVAVEVTRLSKVINIEGQQRSIDNDSSSIIAKLKSVINTFESNDETHSYSVDAIIKRPFGSFKNISLKIKNELQSFNVNKLIKNSYKVVISESVTIHISKCTVQRGNGFLLVGIIDLDAADEDNNVLLDSVLFCLESKERKVKPYHNRYPEWWLVLTDTITYDSILDYKNHLESNLCTSIFNKVIFVNSLTGELVTEI